MALTSSGDLRNWDINSIILHVPYVVDSNTGRAKNGFQYADWQFDGADLIAVFRTAADDGLGGALHYHDANFITFHRIKNFRQRTMENPPLN